MARKDYTPEQAIGMPRDGEVRFKEPWRWSPRRLIVADASGAFVVSPDKQNICVDRRAQGVVLQY